MVYHSTFTTYYTHKLILSSRTGLIALLHCDSVAYQQKMSQPKQTTELLQQLRALMKNKDYTLEPLDAYIIPTADEHNSEYVGPSDQRRTFISGFQGSAGTAIVTKDKALMWTDGRYYLQSSQEMDGNWSLMKEGLPSTPTRAEWLSKNLPPGAIIGADPRVLSNTDWSELNKKLGNANQKLLAVNANLVDLIWKDKASRRSKPLECLPFNITGRSVAEKLQEIRVKMNEERATVLLLSSLDEIAWLLNLRGSDIDYNPVFYSYVLLELNALHVFMNEQQYTKEVEKHLKIELGNEILNVKPYDKVDEILGLISSNTTGFTWLAKSCNYALVSVVPEKSRLIKITPVALMKAIKNPVELRGMRNAHIKDAAALCCYFSWLEQNIDKEAITEITGAAKLEGFRRLQKDFRGSSFATISSAGAHGAIIHYKSSSKTDVPITRDSLYLCDSGGHYLDGTTDITRTFHFGEATTFQKECYTRVLKGQLQVISAVFPSKIKGNCLDSFARQFLWDVGLDFAHGTGHGVGVYLYVHEGPMGLSWRHMPDDPGLQPGMIVTVEPGFYLDGEFGLRIEDVVEVVQANPPHNFNNRGYLTFENLTYVPKQTKLVQVDLLTQREVEILNEYHRKCREIIGPVLEEQGAVEAKTWLWKETEPIAK